MKRLEGQTAIVTGAARGLGRAQAIALAKDGAAVIVSDLDEDAINAVASEINADGGKALAVRLDVTSDADWANAVEQAESQFGNLKVLVNNAGLGTYSPAEETSLADFEKTLEVNTLGAFRGCKQVHPVMKRNGGGSIVNISSIGAVIVFQNTSAYAASKGALNAMTRIWAAEFGPDAIRVNSVMPGPNNTEMNKALREDPEALAMLTRPISLKRLGEPEEVANTVAFLASDEASYMTGVTVPVDGGAAINW